MWCLEAEQQGFKQKTSQKYNCLCLTWENSWNQRKSWIIFLFFGIKFSFMIHLVGGWQPIFCTEYLSCVMPRSWATALQTKNIPEIWLPMFNMGKLVGPAKKLNNLFIFWNKIFFYDSFGRGVAAYFLYRISKLCDA